MAMAKEAAVPAVLSAMAEGKTLKEAVKALEVGVSPRPYKLI